MTKFFYAVILILFTAGIAVAKDPISKKDFIQITDQAMDSLDAVEAALSRSDTRAYDAKEHLRKLDAAIKRYDRHISGKFPPGKQHDIVEKIATAYFQYEIYLLGAGLEEAEKTKAEAHNSAKEARDLFARYRRK